MTVSEKQNCSNKEQSEVARGQRQRKNVANKEQHCTRYFFGMMELFGIPTVVVI